jgi:uncharacterized protein (DUF2384 family)
MVLASPSARIAIQAFEKMADRWHLSRAQRATLLGISERTAYRWAKEPARGDPSRDTLERISHLIAIYEDLRVLFGAGDAADGWVDRPNDDFAGDRPMRRMLGGNVEDIVTVRRYLDLAREGW